MHAPLSSFFFLWHWASGALRFLLSPFQKKIAWQVFSQRETAICKNRACQFMMLIKWKPCSKLAILVAFLTRLVGFWTYACSLRYANENRLPLIKLKFSVAVRTQNLHSVATQNRRGPFGLWQQNVVVTTGKHKSISVFTIIQNFNAFLFNFSTFSAWKTCSFLLLFSFCRKPWMWRWSDGLRFQVHRGEPRHRHREVLPVHGPKRAVQVSHVWTNFHVATEMFCFD